MYRLFFSFILISGGLLSCNSSIEANELYGEWKYIKVETPRTPEENLEGEDLALENPSIRFTKNNDLMIIWGGKRLSYGKYRIEGNIIRYKENLEGGKTREFPFLVSKLTDKELVFETMEQNTTRVTAIRKQ